MNRTTLVRLFAGITVILNVSAFAEPRPDEGIGGAPSLSPHDTLDDLLTHPALAGFAAHLLPWYARPVDRSQALGSIGRLLPYHSTVDPAEITRGLNRLIGEARRGTPVWQPIYTDAERSADPALEAAGLFFIPGERGAPFALIAPGGGFAYVGTVHEGLPYAVRIADAGYNAFVLTYRTGGGGVPATRDMARAVDVILDRADALGVGRANYSVWGSSAGARMAAFIGSDGPVGHGGRSVLKPAAVVMAYTGHSVVGAEEPPTFVVVGGRDAIAPPAAMRPRVEALRQAGTPTAFRVYPRMGHGFGPGTGTEADGWIEDAIAFWSDAVGDRLASEDIRK